MKDKNVRTKTSVAMPSDLKKNNQIKIMEVFRMNSSISAVEVSEATGISRQTVKKAITKFENQGLVKCIGKGDSTVVGGKRPDLYSLSIDRYIFSIGMDIKYMRIAISDMKCEVLHSKSVEYIGQSYEEVLQSIFDAFAELSEEANILVDDVYGVALTTGGLIDKVNGTIMNSLIFPEWGNNVEISKRLQEYFAASIITIDNVSKASGYSLIARNPNHISKRIATIYADKGISSCFIEHGNILDGQNYLIGEIGHMIINTSDDEICGCGNRGCFERQISRDRIEKIIETKERGSSDFYSKDRELIFTDLFNASDRGNVFAREVVDYITRNIAVVIRNISLTFDPDTITFQGIYANAGNYFKESLASALKQMLIILPRDSIAIEYDVFDLLDSQILGSSRLIANNYFNDLYSM